MMRKRKPPVAKNLISNSISGMFSAIEIHNKPAIKYRYEIVVLLALNSWELLLKGYLHKFHKDVKLFTKEGTTKPFESCVNLVNLKLGKDFNPIQENLHVLYEYRNRVAHFYIEQLDPIVFSLISKNVIFYSSFLRSHFKIDISEASDLILLPIGFKKPISPVDYISTASVNENATPEVKAFLKALVSATQRLIDENIDETIFVDFKMNLINVNKIKNADLIAGIDNTKSSDLTISTKKELKNVRVSNEGEKIVLTRNRDEAQATLYYEELQDGIFDEINNILDANRILAKSNKKFMLGASLYYRIYSERQHVNFNIESFELLARTGAADIYGPFLFWLTKLPANRIVDILLDLFKQAKSPNIHNLTKISLIIGDEVADFFEALLQEKYQKVIQKPDFLYTFLEQRKSKKGNPILRALRAAPSKAIANNSTYGQMLKDSNIPLQFLSVECLNVFKGQTTQRSLTRELDYLTYGHKLIDNQQIVEEIRKRK